jgi:hypothetical protein
MDRNAPCPCGSGRKFKKCHGAAVPPEVAALAPDARAEWLKGDVVLQRQKRVGQELLDWAEKKLGPEWVDKALGLWGIGEEDDIDEAFADLFTTWSLFNHVPATLSAPVAQSWLDDAVGRKADADTRALVSAAVNAPLGMWEVETVEAGVGTTITDGLSGTTSFVHEPDLTHDLAPGEFILAYVIETDGVRVFSGLHADTLLMMDGKALLGDVLADVGVTSAPMPREKQTEAAWQVKLAKGFTDMVFAAYGDEDDEADEDGEYDDDPVKAP